MTAIVKLKLVIWKHAVQDLGKDFQKKFSFQPQNLVQVRDINYEVIFKKIFSQVWQKKSR